MQYGIVIANYARKNFKTYVFFVLERRGIHIIVFPDSVERKYADGAKLNEGMNGRNIQEGIPISKQPKFAKPKSGRAARSIENATAPSAETEESEAW